MGKLKEAFSAFTSLFYPNLCMACRKNTPVPNALLCSNCLYDLPKTNFHLDKDNLFAEKFWGRIQIESAVALYYFSKKGSIQSLIHNLKYKGYKEIGTVLGKDYGLTLKNEEAFQDIDLILPVPLHKRKLKSRGYNQSTCIAEGVSDGLNVILREDILIRTAFTETQTKKSREERFENVKKAFIVAKPEELKNKHILLVDDVVTTGATLEACGRHILDIEGTRLSFLTLAIGGD